MKRLLCYLLAAATALSLCACANPNNSSGGGSDQDGKVTISVWSGYPDQQAWFDWLVPAFEEANPDIHVELTTFPISDFETKVFAAIPAAQAGPFSPGRPFPRSLFPCLIYSCGFWTAVCFSCACISCCGCSFAACSSA